MGLERRRARFSSRWRQCFASSAPLLPVPAQSVLGEPGMGAGRGAGQAPSLEKAHGGFGGEGDTRTAVPRPAGHGDTGLTEPVLGTAMGRGGLGGTRLCPGAGRMGKGTGRVHLPLPTGSCPTAPLQVPLCASVSPGEVSTGSQCPVFQPHPRDLAPCVPVHIRALSCDSF